MNLDSMIPEGTELPFFPRKSVNYEVEAVGQFVRGLQVRRLYPDAKLPTRATPDSAGLDLYAYSVEPFGSYMVRIDTGIAVEIPDGYTGFIFPRSSITGLSLRLANCVGVIDSGYRGPLMLRFDDLELPDSGPNYKPGDRVGQLILLATPRFEVVEVQELSETARGQGGFGSTGA